MSYELFTELSVAQQEVVSGGSITTDVTDDLETVFKEQNFYLDSDVYSNKEGSAIKQKTASQNIYTQANKYFDLYLA